MVALLHRVGVGEAVVSGEADGLVQGLDSTRQEEYQHLATQSYLWAWPCGAGNRPQCLSQEVDLGNLVTSSLPAQPTWKPAKLRTEVRKAPCQGQPRGF